MSDALLEVEALDAGYDEVQVLWGLSLDVARGRITTLVGANGAGKTTTLRAVAGTLTPWSGRVLFKGEDVTRLPAARQGRARARAGARRPPAVQRHDASTRIWKWARSRAARADAYADRLEQVFTLFPRLKERRRQKAGTFSGGEQQMLAIARGLMSDPEILIIDELSLGLAPVLV